MDSLRIELQFVKRQFKRLRFGMRLNLDIKLRRYEISAHNITFQLDKVYPVGRKTAQRLIQCCRNVLNVKHQRRDEF